MNDFDLIPAGFQVQPKGFFLRRTLQKNVGFTDSWGINMKPYYAQEAQAANI